MGYTRAMPWKDPTVTEQRMEFIAKWMTGTWSMTELCRAYHVSRKTGYKIVSRYVEQGVDGLKDQSRAPHKHSNATSPKMVRRILAVRKTYGWGGRKIVDYLGRRPNRVGLPAPSTVDEILRRHGLVKSRRRRAKRSEVSGTSTRVQGPNDRWCADFKGWFRTGDGSRCDPLTVTDSYSRMLLRCRHLPSLGCADAKPQFVRAFRQFGLPRSIRTDNGSPFASTGIAGLSRLSVWFIRLEIYPDFIDPGQPQQNGRHERMHRTLKADTARPPKTSLRAQQRSFDNFRAMFNNERPHEGINGHVPADLYRKSERSYPNRLPTLEYPDGALVRKVSDTGVIKVDGQNLFLGRALRGQHVALQPISDRHFSVHFGPYEIATVDPRANEVLMYRKPKQPKT